tara:strand:- start:8 stop:121 length:114 start_codon:yes stop_codon:yes gene_type:complete
MNKIVIIISEKIDAFAITVVGLANFMVFKLRDDTLKT